MLRAKLCETKLTILSSANVLIKLYIYILPSINSTEIFKVIFIYALFIFAQCQLLMIGHYEVIDEQNAPAINQNHVREWAETYFDLHELLML